ncbi:MAG: glutamine synthetase [Chloroflexi bacterium]|nr:glutamine synthetase [Chloroflexota bacterium]|tara:strand:- start:487 stop:1533 length:1047 start_codon:yes stop_codon:yes gene_type:complete
MSNITAEYIWIDGTSPTPQLRSKTKVLKKEEILSMGTSSMGADSLAIWGFDGSSTNQAEGASSDCVLNPVFICPDPIRGGDNILVLCEVLNPDMTPHSTNTRKETELISKKYENHEGLFGIEQEYTMLDPVTKQPIGFPEEGFPEPQGPYYCSVGASWIFGREMAEEHMALCLDAGLAISGINAEVMPGQWEFQIGPVSALEVSDHLWIARWLLFRIGELHGIHPSLDPKPVPGDWNGAGAHTNFSTKAMRDKYQPIIDGCEALAEKHDLHISNYGDGNERRLTGLHETQSIDKFSYGASDRGASIRIPWQVEKDQKGYLEDRRPSANMDPYTVTKLLLETICSKEPQ